MTRKRVDAVGLVLLVVGGLLVPLIGWLPGLIIVWKSSRWTTAQKLAGSAVFPAMMLASPVLFHLSAGSCAGQGCSAGGPSKAVAVGVLVLIGLAVLAAVAWLTRRLIQQ